MGANNIKALRVASKKTQAQVAEDLGVKLERYRSWEQGKRNPTGKMGIVVAEYFGVSTDTVFGSQFAEAITPNLSKEEERLVDAYRLLNDSIKLALLNLMETLASAQEA